MTSNAALTAIAIICVTAIVIALLVIAPVAIIFIMAAKKVYGDRGKRNHE